MEHRGYGLVCGDGDWFIYKNGELVGKAESDTEARAIIDRIEDNK